MILKKGGGVGGRDWSLARLLVYALKSQLDTFFLECDYKTGF